MCHGNIVSWTGKKFKEIEDNEISTTNKTVTQMCQIKELAIMIGKYKPITYVSTLKGVCPCPELPVSPKLILPIPSGPKHMEKEFAVSPFLAKTLGTDMSFIPRPNRPLGAAPSKNEPV